MRWDFVGQKVLIAGGSRGIGLHLAEAFVKAGAHLAVCGRDRDALEAAEVRLSAVRGPDQRLFVSACDLADPTELRRWTLDSANELGGLDIVVCTATGQATGSSQTDWTRSVTIDLMVPVNLIDSVVPYLAESASAAVLLVASRSALRPAPIYTAYAAIKAAVMHLTQSKAALLAKQSIRVNCVAPGSTQYPGGLWERMEESEPELYRATVEQMPNRRLAKPADIVPAMLFLCSGDAGWITGQTLLVDGGQTLK